MRVLFVGQALSGGGAETRLRLLAKHAFAGEANVAVLRGVANEGSPMAIDLKWNGRRSYALVILRLRKLLVQGKYDVVMSFGIFPNIISVIAVFLSRKRPKLIISEITRPRVQAHTGGLLRGKLYLLLQGLFYPRCDRLTANSIDGLAEACSLARIPLRDGVRVPNVMNLDSLRDLANQEAGNPVNAPYFICVSRLDRMKRMDTVIEAWARMGEMIDARLVIVGDGEVRGELDELIQSKGLRDRISLVGASSNPMPLLARSMGFILASEYEGFSNSVLEAMCLDVPVITSLCSSDAVQMCQLGAALGFEVGDAAGLKHRVVELLESKQLADTMVAQARVYREPHLVPDAIQAYESLIRDCAGVAEATDEKFPCAG